MKYWLIKTEPHEWSWQQQVTNVTCVWYGVHNYQARNFMKEMKLHDICFFYHTGKQREIMGVVKVIKEHYPEGIGSFVCVDIEYVKSFNTPVTLSTIKAHAVLSNLKIVAQPRLSVSPVLAEHAKLLIELGEGTI